MVRLVLLVTPGICNVMCVGEIGVVVVVCAVRVTVVLIVDI